MSRDYQMKFEAKFTLEASNSIEGRETDFAILLWRPISPPPTRLAFPNT